VYGKNHKVYCEKFDQAWAFISHKLGSEVPVPVNVNGVLHESPKVRALKWYKNGLHVLTVTTVVGFIVHQSVVKCREDIVKCREDIVKCREDIVKCREDIVKCREDIVKCKEDIVKCRGDIVKCREDIVKCREDIVKLPNATALKVIGT